MSDHPTLTQLDQALPFARRHIGPDADARATMLTALGFGDFTIRLNHRQALTAMLARNDREVSVVLSIVVADEEVIKRKALLRQRVV